MMDFNEFQNQILQEAKERMWGVQVEIRPVEKLQGESYTGLSIQPNDSPVAATLNLDAVYNQMVDQGKPSRRLRMILSLTLWMSLLICLRLM